EREILEVIFCFFFSSRRRHTRWPRDWSSDVCSSDLFFDSGRASLKDTGKDVLKKVGEALKGYEDKVIRVVGHTDNVPISKAAQRSEERRVGKECRSRRSA